MPRIYEYNYKIHDRLKGKDIEVISLAVLTDEDENFRDNVWVVKRWGFEHRLVIPVVKIIDFRTKKELVEKLETSKNIFAMVVIAHLRNFEAKKQDILGKYSIKTELIRLCFERGYRKKQIASLLKFIDWLILLPEDLDEKLSVEIEKIKEVQKMPYVTSWERIGEKKGIAKGLEKGEKKGEKKGVINVARRMLSKGVSVEDIIQFTGLPKRSVLSLSN
jgi:hypothetical protein